VVNVRNVLSFLARQHRPLIRRRTKVGRGGIADGGSEPVAQRHAGAARSGLGPLADGWIDALNTPRYARIHAFVRFRLRRAAAPSASPRVPREETIEFRAGRLPHASTFSFYDK